MKLLRVSVVTPSLNKSFKFQSDWPYNNSQVYLLNSILEDLLEDEDREFKTKDDGYYFTSNVHYPNNKSLVRQKVYLDKDGNITKTEVVDKEDNVQIVMEFKNQEFNKKFDKNYFELSELLNTNTKKTTNKKNTSEESDSNNSNNSSTRTDDETTNEQQNNSDNSINNTRENNNTNNNDNTNSETQDNNSNATEQSNTETEEKTKQTATIDDVIYPMYLPDNTYLTSQETIDTEDGQRLILTFGGDSSFILVEETLNVSEEGMVIPVSGEFDFLSDVIGVIGTNSLTWHSNGIEYYMASDSITTAELVEIARSISVLPVSK